MGKRTRPCRRLGPIACAAAAVLIFRRSCPSFAASHQSHGLARSPEGRAKIALRSSWLDFLEEAVGTPTPEAADPAIPSGKPLDPALVTKELRAFELEEKGITMSGEDFEVKSPEGELLLKIGGGNRIPIPGMPVWDKLSLATPSGQTIGFLDRQAIAMTTTYDVLRADGSKFGRINKAMFAFTATFELWEEGHDEGPLLKAEGSFSDKNYILKCKSGKVVATVARLPGFSGGNVDNYNVIVGPHVDASLVLAMAVVIDEVHDEENPNAEGGEGLRDMLEDASGLPMPKRADPPIPSGRAPLDAELVHAATTAYELEEKGLSLSGEDFEVKSPTGQLLLRISGGNRLPIGGLPVWDKLTVSSAAGASIMTLEREMISMTPTYDVLRSDGSQFGKINKAMFGFSESFEFHLEGDGSGPVLKAEGTFSERRFEIKSRDGQVVATVGRGYYQTDSENRYHLIVGPQVDASMVVALAFVIDEVHDEEDRAKGEGDGGGGLFR